MGGAVGSASFTDIASVTISLFALVISIVALWQSRRHMTVEFDRNLKKPYCFFETLEDGQQFNNPIINQDGYIISFSVINPSPRDIAYFEMEVLCLDQDNKLVQISGLYMPGFQKRTKSLSTYFYERDKTSVSQVAFCNQAYGVYMAQSYNRVHIYTKSTDTRARKKYICFKIAKPSLFRRAKYDIQKKKRWYQAFWQIYDLDNATVLPLRQTEE